MGQREGPPRRTAGAGGVPCIAVNDRSSMLQSLVIIVARRSVVASSSRPRSAPGRRRPTLQIETGGEREGAVTLQTRIYMQVIMSDRVLHVPPVVRAVAEYRSPAPAESSPQHALHRTAAGQISSQTPASSFSQSAELRSLDSMGRERVQVTPLCSGVLVGVGRKSAVAAAAQQTVVFCSSHRMTTNCTWRHPEGPYELGGANHTLGGACLRSPAVV